ncbi:MAG TPA: PCRF domain-containing protein, partial [bacterium]|nr:PCRF domain-containing protein [bacterium]
MALTARDIESAIRELSQKQGTLKASLDIDRKRERLADVERQLNDPAVWGNTDLMASLNREKRLLQNGLTLFASLERAIGEFLVSAEFAREDAGMAVEAENHLGAAQQIIGKLEFQKMLGGKTDPNNAFLSINAGAGGRESQDWATMLLRMYLRWAERRGMQVEEMDRVTGDDATGIKSVTILISGEYAYGYLKAEIGVHRLVRISPFDANKRRHTSFASVFVTPEIDDSIEIDI